MSIMINIKNCTMKKTIRINIKNAMSLGIQWVDICNYTGLNEWALNEGYDENNTIEIPIEWIKMEIKHERN